jgi:ketosteroid isomerase-like protein
MTLAPAQIAEAFTSHRFADTYPYMADDIKWSMVGGQEFVGREAVQARCAWAMKFLETVTTTLTKQRIYPAEPCVIVEGAAEFRHQQGHISRVASCDFFRFSEGRLVEITSYVIELNES